MTDGEFLQLYASHRRFGPIKVLRDNHAVRFDDTNKAHKEIGWNMVFLRTRDAEKRKQEREAEKLVEAK